MRVEYVAILVKREDYERLLTQENGLGTHAVLGSSICEQADPSTWAPLREDREPAQRPTHLTRVK